ncbi:hypothetical protein SERLA73DRAFT_80287 [Serpula lacrymans var. lacrymans S7.3]|uniref:FAD linked oxidase N-terminal domain-containing protein n=1 Tax=Serpula lacrymans var. lacrymans (strain S7.3) TaxID=936435 RepID=F8QJA7_SERL3|nr:hypothetical protein SERLA73DRAFT_80287 [Serpula lacrymans var. lacrymans S7.3]
MIFTISRLVPLPHLPHSFSRLQGHSCLSPLLHPRRKPQNAILALAVFAAAGGASLFSAINAYSMALRIDPSPINDLSLPAIHQPPIDTPPTSNFSLAIDDLRAAFPHLSIVSTDPNELYAYAQSTYSQIPGLPHAVIVHVRSTDDVVKVVNISRNHLVPIVPYAGGTSLEGNLSAVSR